MIYIVGKESNVRKTPFYNSQIISDLVDCIPGLNVIDVHHRCFINRFGETIQEDLLEIEKETCPPDAEQLISCFETVGFKHLEKAIPYSPEENKADIYAILEKKDNRILRNLPTGFELETGSQTSFMSLAFCPTSIQELDKPQVVIKEKDQDFTIGKSLFYKFSSDSNFNIDKTIAGKLFLAVLAVECKVNYDKTMFQECAGTAARLKQGCPISKYYALVEYLDMQPEDTRLTSIDNVFLLRKVKRLPYEKRNVYEEVRAQHQDHPIDANVVLRFVSEMQNFIDATWYNPDEALLRGSFV